MRRAALAGFIVGMIGCTSSGSTTSTTSTTTSSSSGMGGSTSTASTSTGDPCAGLDLTKDPQNCGVCGRSCLGGACVASVCQAMGTPIPNAEISTVNDLTADEDGVYFEGEGQSIGYDALYRLKRDGSAPDDLGYLAWDPPTFLFARGDLVYALTGSCCTGSNLFWFDKSTGKLNEGGGASGADAIAKAWVVSKRALTVGDQRLYAVGMNDASFARAEWSDIANQTPSAVTGNSHTFLVSSTTSMGVTNLYGVEESDLKSGANFPMTLVAPWVGGIDIAANDAYVFGAAGTTLRRVDLTTKEEKMFTLAAVYRGHLVATKDRVFYLSADAMNANGKVQSIGVDGTDETTIATSPDYIRGLYADEREIAWTTSNPNMVWERAR